MIDITFNFRSDSNGGDPDSKSPTLKKYHKFLWDKPLPNGKQLKLSSNKSGAYLFHSSSLGEFKLSSDTISHSYRSHKLKKKITEQLQKDVLELYNLGATIGAFILFPGNKIDGAYTINQARGVNRYIDDRFDLTLECIRRFYLQEKSPLFETLNRYKDFFYLFNSFNGYVNFFLLDDLIDDNGQVKFYLPFDDFKSKPKFSSTQDYLTYKNKVAKFIRSRNNRIQRYVDNLK